MDSWARILWKLRGASTEKTDRLRQQLQHLAHDLHKVQDLAPQLFQDSHHGLTLDSACCPFRDSDKGFFFHSMPNGSHRKFTFFTASFSR